MKHPYDLRQMSWKVGGCSRSNSQSTHLMFNIQYGHIVALSISLKYLSSWHMGFLIGFKIWSIILHFTICSDVCSMLLQVTVNAIRLKKELTKKFKSCLNTIPLRQVYHINRNSIIQTHFQNRAFAYRTSFCVVIKIYLWSLIKT